MPVISAAAQAAFDWFNERAAQLNQRALADLRGSKSSRSQGNGNCIMSAGVRSGLDVFIAVWDSKNPEGGRLDFRAEEFEALCDSAQGGEFDTCSPGNPVVMQFGDNRVFSCAASTEGTTPTYTWSLYAPGNDVASAVQLVFTRDELRAWIGDKRGRLRPGDPDGVHTYDGPALASASL